MGYRYSLLLDPNPRKGGRDREMEGRKPFGVEHALVCQISRHVCNLQASSKSPGVTFYNIIAIRGLAGIAQVGGSDMDESLTSYPVS